MNKRTAVIIGAGPAGLTAALELLRRSDIRVVVLERSAYMGGIARTVRYQGNRIDVGGHRFFSKSDRVMAWWLDILPLDGDASGKITYHQQTREIGGRVRATGDPKSAIDPAVDAAPRKTMESRAAMTPIATQAVGSDATPIYATQQHTAQQERPRNPDRVMLVRPRKSRIYYLRKFFDYPVALNFETLRGLGLARTFRISASYAWSVVHRIQPEVTLEDFMINRFGRELYSTFFKAYTEKVWGVPCNQISSEWGAQRIKGLSISKAIRHWARGLFRKRRAAGESDVRQKDTETSLIEQFLYPKLGPGQMWETVADEVAGRGGEIITRFTVDRVNVEGTRVAGVEGRDESGEKRSFEADFVFSTMPVQELVESLSTDVPENVRNVARRLQYRNFITVALLLKKLDVRGAKDPTQLDDTWLYIQEPDVRVGRVQIFNNWSPHLIADPSLTWLGFEYFCNADDKLWRLDDRAMIDTAIAEGDKIGLISKRDVIDATVIRMPKTYPGYFGAYAQFHEVREYVDRFENLFLVGRNGMHKYNNQDHSMLTAMEAVDAILAGVTDKSKIWAVNTEADYHESMDDE